jgi:SAM-dependent methyltransferase
MHPGPLVRRLFGPYEHGVAEAYRKIFVDLDDLAGLMNTWVPKAHKILEVGCGEGAMTERITRLSSVKFCHESVENIAAKEPGSFDLVILADVIHHVPAEARRSLLSAIAQAMAPTGSLIFKDWVVSSSPIHWLCLMSDRYLTGDDVVYCTMGGINTLVADIFGPETIHQVDTVRPWRNNVAVHVTRSQHGMHKASDQDLALART